MTYCCVKKIFILFVITNSYFALETNNLAFVIISQENSYNVHLSENLKDDIIQQSKILTPEGQPQIYLTHKDFSGVDGAWTIFPLIPILANLYRKTDFAWVFFLEDRTKLNLEILVQVLSRYDSEKEIWIGHALYDREATIIHHFAFFKDPTFFKYPNIASGFAISVPLINKLDTNLRERTEKPSDFHIDVSHEFALFVWNNGKGHMLQHDKLFCTKESPKCASYPLKFKPCVNKGTLTKNSIYFAVKTYEKFHKSRVSVVKKTWGQYAAKIKYFSNVEDLTIPTIDLGIPNTEQGHCAKTTAILRYAAKEMENQPEVRWIVIADDDTILSVSRLYRLLSCNDHTKEIALGERYRYKGYSHTSQHGYDYITGGGGIVFSRVVLENLVKNCHCPTNNTPDDMQIGVCLAYLGVKVTHSPYLHQARPIDYASGFLDTKDAVSFHKHWMIDPIKVYTEWFKGEDAIFFTNNTLGLHNSNNNNRDTRTEL